MRFTIGATARSCSWATSRSRSGLAFRAPSRRGEGLLHIRWLDRAKREWYRSTSVRCLAHAARPNVSPRGSSHLAMPMEREASRDVLYPQALHALRGVVVHGAPRDPA